MQYAIKKYVLELKTIYLYPTKPKKTKNQSFE